MNAADLDAILHSSEFTEFVKEGRLADEGVQCDLEYLDRIKHYRELYGGIKQAIETIETEKERGQDGPGCDKLSQEAVQLIWPLHAAALAIVYEYMLTREEQLAVDSSDMATALGKEWIECRDKVVLAHQSAAARASTLNRKLISLLRVPAPGMENFIVLTITPAHARHLTLHAARDALLQHLLETPLASFPHTLSTWSLTDLDPKMFTVAATAVRSHLRHVVLPHFDQHHCARDVSNIESTYFLTLSALFLVAIACWLYLTYDPFHLTRTQRVLSTFPLAWCASAAYETAMRRVLLIGSNAAADKPAQWSSEVIHGRIRLIRKRVRQQMLHGAFVFALACSVVVGVIVPESVAVGIEDMLTGLDAKVQSVK